MSEKVVNAALLGLGTVGTGVYKVIKNQEQEMTAKLGCQVKITKILVRNLEKASGASWAETSASLPSVGIIAAAMILPSSGMRLSIMPTVR